MSKLSEKQLMVLTIGVTVLLTGGLVALVLNDRSEIDALEEEIATIETHIEAANVEIRKTKKREEKVLVFRAVEEREVAVLPSVQKISDFHRNISTFFTSSGMSFLEAPESSPNESELAKGIFETRTKLTCRGDAAQILKFINMVENDPRLIAVKGFEISAGRRDPENRNAPVRHDVELVLATYFYNPSASGGFQRVHIPGEERRLQEESLKAAIAEFQPERPDSYVLRPSASRRDALVDPRKERVRADPKEIEDQYRREDEIVVEVEEANRGIAELMEQEKALIKAGDVFRADKVGRDIDRLSNELRARISQVIEMKSVLIPELQVKVQTVEADLEAAMARRPHRQTTVTRPIAEKQYAELLKLFEEGAYTEMSSMISAWTAYLHDKQIGAGARPVLEQIRNLKTKAKTHSEFQAMAVHVRGTIIDPDNPRRSIALTNHGTLRMGDKLNETGDVVVGRITKSWVYFEYRDETIRVPAVGSAGGDTKVRAVNK